MRTVDFALPGVGRFFTAVVEHVLDGQNVVVVVPDAVDGSSLIRGVRGLIDRSGMDAVPIHSNDAERDDLGAVVALISLAVGESETDGRPFAVLARMFASDWFPATIVIDDLDVPSTADTAWSQVLAEWARVTGQVTSGNGRRPPLYVVFCRPRTAVASLQPDVRLVVTDLVGAVSQLDCRWVCRGLVGFNKEASDRFWADAVLVELAGFDPALLEALLSSRAGSLPDLLPLLVAYGNEVGWTVSGLYAAGASVLRNGVGVRFSARPSVKKEWLSLWQMGAADYVEETGVELHSAAAAILGWDDMIGHRVWRGQARLLLPLLDSARMAVARKLLPFETPRAMQDRSPTFPQGRSDWPEFSELTERVKDLGERGMVSRRTCDLVFGLKRYRNQIAHYQPLSKREFRECLRAVDSVTSTGTGLRRKSPRML